MSDPTKVKETLNLPKTGFSMKARLAEKEPEILKMVRAIHADPGRQEGSPAFVLPMTALRHRNLHLATSMNKISDFS
jgi:isoleucyl-tRNA synthetase